jgi:uncharacterized protein YdeI (YjbR/CyaY-like superfamily)
MERHRPFGQVRVAEPPGLTSAQSFMHSAGRGNRHPRRGHPHGTPDLEEIRRRVRFFANRAELRSWFERHHATTPELWIGYFKMGIDEEGVRYAEAVDEALCFGWIDGQVRSLDVRTYANRYTPRKAGSRWSRTNIRRVQELKRAGRMHRAGLAAFAEGGPRRPTRYLFETGAAQLSPPLASRFREDATAWKNFRAEPPGYQRTMIRWVMSAIRKPTQERRLAHLIRCSRQGRRLDPMSPARAPAEAPNA